MSKYRFDQIAINSTAKKKPTEEDKYHYIGLEHIDSQNLIVSRWGSEIAPKGEKLLMKKGDVLFGKRRAYQKKVAIAPFDGIFSAHGMVLRPNEEVVDKDFFPMFISSDYFLDAAIAISVGSLSPTINWKDLARLEFDLPPMEEQRKLAAVLWSINDTLLAYQKLLTETDALVQAQFVEMFGDPVVNEKSYPLKKIEEIASTRLGKMLDSKRQSGLHQFPYLANANVQWFHFDLNNLNQMDFNDKDRVEFSLRDGDLLVCEGGEVGRCAIWRNNMRDCFFQKAIHRVRCNEKIIIPEYLAYNFLYHSKQNGFSDIVGTRSTIAHLPGDKLRNMKIVLPPLNLQYEFKNYSEQAEKSKSALLNTITSLQATKRCILENALRTGRKE